MKKTFLPWLSGMCMILLVVLTAVDWIALNKDWYAGWYENSRLSEQLGVSNEAIESAMNMMLDYVAGNAASMDGQLEELGEVYNAKEKAHMKDVRSLYESAMQLRQICCGIVVAVVLYYLLTGQPGWLAWGYISAGCCWLVLIAFLGLWMATGFDDFWTHFHQLFFSNDLWLLDPATDFMINICPEKLFSDLIGQILIFILAVTGGFGIVSWLGIRQRKS